MAVPVADGDHDGDLRRCGAQRLDRRLGPLPRISNGTFRTLTRHTTEGPRRTRGPGGGDTLDRDETLARFEELRAGGAAFHGSGTDASTFVNWQLAPDVLRWLLDVVGPESRTLETGAGHSTVVFALAGTDHTAVSPRAYEHDRIRDWCEERGISLDRVAFLLGESQIVLPAHEPTPLDLVLIDGDHAFPTPFIDWYFTAGRLRPGGMVVVDDTQIRSCGLLCEFLASETDRWTPQRTFERTAVFARTAAAWRAPDGWVGQPFCRPQPSRLRSLAQLVVGRPRR